MADACLAVPRGAAPRLNGLDKKDFREEMVRTRFLEMKKEEGVRAKAEMGSMECAPLPGGSPEGQVGGQQMRLERHEKGEFYLDCGRGSLEGGEGRLEGQDGMLGDPWEALQRSRGDWARTLASTVAEQMQ